MTQEDLMKKILIREQTILDAFNDPYIPRCKFICEDVNVSWSPVTIESGDVLHEPASMLFGVNAGYMLYVAYTDITGTVTTLPYIDQVTTVNIPVPIMHLEVYSEENDQSQSASYITVNFEPVHITGIFDAIKGMYNPDFDLDLLDLEWITNHASDKRTSPIIQRMADRDGTVYEDHVALSFESVLKLASLVARKYLPSWTKIYDAMVEEYAPLENYHRNETIEYDTNDEHGVSDDYLVTDSEKRNTNLTSTIEDATNETDVYGFNSGSTPVPESKQTTNTSQTTSGDKDDNTIETEHSQVGSTNDAKTGTVETETYGNIGVTTSQQMLESEIQLRVNNRIRDIIMADADNMLTQPVFSCTLSKNILREDF